MSREQTDVGASVASFALSAFGDEVMEDLAGQLQVLRGLGISRLELRAAWGTNVVRLDAGQLVNVRRLCTEYGVAVSCLGSPIGKSPLAGPLVAELDNLERACEVGEVLGCRLIRVFSFYPADTRTNAHYDDHVAEAAGRLARLAELAGARGFRLLLENEKDIVGDTPERCLAILKAVDSPHLGFVWDPANFVQVGVARPTTHAWPYLGPYVAYVHVKDALLAGGAVRPAGEGDGEVPELLAALRDAAYRGVLALEPHLQFAGPAGGVSGPEGLARATAALRRLLAAAGCREV